MAREIHITAIRNAGVYGHETKHCGDAGCSGDELYWAGLDAANVGKGEVVALPDHGALTDYATGESIRPATAEERKASLAAAELDNGVGAIKVDGRTVYVAD